MLPKPRLSNERFTPNPFINDNIRSLTRTRDHWLRLARQTTNPAMWSGDPAKFQKRSQMRNSTGTKGIRRGTKIKQNTNYVGYM